MKRRREHGECDKTPGGRGCLVFGTKVCTFRKDVGKLDEMRRWARRFVRNTTTLEWILLGVVGIAIAWWWMQTRKAEVEAWLSSKKTLSSLRLGYDDASNVMYNWNQVSCNLLWAILNFLFMNRAGKCHLHRVWDQRGICCGDLTTLKSMDTARWILRGAGRRKAVVHPFCFHR